MANIFDTYANYPKIVGTVSHEAVTLLEGQGYFSLHFRNESRAKAAFYETFCESLLQKFLTGEDIEWEEGEYERVLALATVEQAVAELESEGKLHRFGHTVVLAG